MARLKKTSIIIPDHQRMNLLKRRSSVLFFHFITFPNLLDAKGCENELRDRFFCQSLTIMFFMPMATKPGWAVVTNKSQVSDKTDCHVTKGRFWMLKKSKQLQNLLRDMVSTATTLLQEILPWASNSFCSIYACTEKKVN